MTRKEFGGDGAEGTPGTIPNPEVKLRRGDDRGGTPENSALPSSFLLSAPEGAFLFGFLALKGYLLPMKWNFINAIKETEHRFLNFYTVNYDVFSNDSEKSYSYFLASRNESIDGLRLSTKNFTRPDAVLIGAYHIDDSGRLFLLLEKQFRPALGRDVLSFPAGLMDKEDKREEDTAVRECLEETGYGICDVEVIVPPSPTSEGLSDECNSVVICRLSKKGDSSKEEFEDISASLYSEAQVREMLNDKSLLFSNSARLLILLLLERFGTLS